MSLILSGTDGLSDVDGSAATPAIRGTDANTGIFFPAADTIAFSEGGVEAMRIDSSANLQFNSGYGSVATAYGCRAWVNFNADGTVTIRASGNVTSITDDGVGRFTMNFTTAMPNTNYCPVGGGGGTIRNNTLTNVAFPDSLRATGSVGIDTQYAHTTAFDPPIVAVAIFR